MSEKIFNERFEKALKKTLAWEGGYVDNTSDLGGKTKYGISQRAYPNLDIENLDLSQAKKIYYEEYWLANKCNVIANNAIAEKFFDLSVNLGCYRATVLLQRACRAVSGIILVEDGIFGPKTLKTVNNSNSELLLVALRVEAAGFYRLLVSKNSSQNVFLKGWLNRAYA